MKIEFSHREQKIEIEQGFMSGRETLWIDGEAVSTISAFFKNDTRHEFELRGEGGIEQGFVRIKSFLGEGMRVYALFIAGRFQAAQVHKAFVGISDLVLAFILYVPLAVGTLAVDAASGLVKHPLFMPIASAEILLLLLLSLGLAKIIRRPFAARVFERIKDEMGARINKRLESITSRAR